MANAYYSAEDILQILRDGYNFQSVFDPEVDAGEELTFDTTVSDWRAICDLITPAQLAAYYQELFTLTAPLEALRKLLSDKNSSLRDLCAFISAHAVRDAIPPIKTMNTSCKTAAIFKTLVRNLSKKGVDVSEIRPSSLLKSKVRPKELALWMEQVNLIAPGTLTYFKHEPNIVERLGGLFMLAFIVAIIIVPLVWQFHISLFLPLAFSIVLLIVGEKLKPRRLVIGGYDTVRDMVLAMEARMA